MIVESGQAAHAAGGQLISAGSVRLSGLSGVGGVDGIGNPEIHAAEGDEGNRPEPTPGDAPRVQGSGVRAAGAEVGVTFAGLNHRDNRLANGGNQFSSEPPDQALCVGPNHVLEGVNTVLQVFNKDGSPASPVISYNEFFNYAPAIDRTTGVFGAFLTDPICHFDADSGRFFMAVLTLDQDPGNGQFTGKNRLDIAVSETDDPTGDWFLYKLPVQNDGTEGTPDHHCDPEVTPPPEMTNPAACIGDFPHIGTDNYGVYLTTNEYSFFGDGSEGGFAYTGSQIYAFSKSQLITGATQPAMVSFENPNLGPFRSFTVWPAISPAGQASNDSGGTEFFLSSTLGDGSETGNTAPSENRIGVWAITNTSSIDSATPKLQLSNKLIKADTYTLPPHATQKDGPTPLRDCVNDTSDLFGQDADGNNLGCWFLFFDPPAPPHADLTTMDSSDTRMNQVIYSGGRLFGAIGTGVKVGGSTRAGVLWVNVDAKVKKGTLKEAEVKKSGYVGIRNNDVTYPALGVSSSGKVVMAATVTGDDHYPSASYTVLSGKTPTVRIISEGVGPDDGFTGYAAFVGDPPRPRWGDYGAVAMDGDTLWLASESIEQSCTLDEYLDLANFPDTVGSCNGTRTALANWGTRVSALQI
ncbi:MAG TPA: hypothetical protein VHQ23_04315 [Ilumatobacteraceae bacterium]|nr:hypothetical protein [Ilumatobacteraceae bacterium]